LLKDLHLRECGFMKSLNFFSRFLMLAVSVAVGLAPLRAQAGKDAKEIVRTAMNAELSADLNDHTRWRYRDSKRDGTDTTSIVVETDYGSVKRMIARNGRPLNEAETRAEDDRVQRLIRDPAQLAKQKRDGAQDGKSAEELLRMLPDAFLWNVQSEDARTITLHFQPKPEFHPPDMQSRVLGEMVGELVVNKEQHRIETIRGKLVEDVTIGWGLLGRLHEGGTFRVERREVAPRLWQITETHVHIEGRALFFKNIGQEQDEVQTDFTQVSAGTTLEQAAEMSKAK
jgi:hypothetical protein